MTLAEKIFNCFKQHESFTLNDAYQVNSGKPHETIRARIYDNLGIRFERIAKGVYKTIDEENTCVLLEGDGRDLSMLAAYAELAEEEGYRIGYDIHILRNAQAQVFKS